MWLPARWVPGHLGPAWDTPELWGALLNPLESSRQALGGRMPCNPGRVSRELLPCVWWGRSFWGVAPPGTAPCGARGRPRATEPRHCLRLKTQEQAAEKWCFVNEQKRPRGPLGSLLLAHRGREAAGGGGRRPWTSSVQPVRPGVGGRPPGLGGVGCPLESRPTCAPPRITFHSRTCSLAHPTAPTPVKERQTRAVPAGVLGTRDTRVTPGSRGGVCVCAGVEMWFHELSLRQAAVLVGVALALAIGLVGTAQPQ